MMGKFAAAAIRDSLLTALSVSVIAFSIWPLATPRQQFSWRTESGQVGQFSLAIDDPRLPELQKEVDASPSILPSSDLALAIWRKETAEFYSQQLADRADNAASDSTAAATATPEAGPGQSKTEPTALAAGVETDANQSLRPEASADGSRKKSFSTGQAGPGIAPVSFDGPASIEGPASFEPPVSFEPPMSNEPGSVEPKRPRHSTAIPVTPADRQYWVAVAAKESQIIAAQRRAAIQLHDLQHLRELRLGNIVPSQRSGISLFLSALLGVAAAIGLAWWAKICPTIRITSHESIESGKPADGDDRLSRDRLRTEREITDASFPSPCPWPVENDSLREPSALASGLNDRLASLSAPAASAVGSVFDSPPCPSPASERGNHRTVISRSMLRIEIPSGWVRIHQPSRVWFRRAAQASLVLWAICCCLF